MKKFTLTIYYSFTIIFQKFGAAIHHYNYRADLDKAKAFWPVISGCQIQLFIVWGYFTPSFAVNVDEGATRTPLFDFSNRNIIRWVAGYLRAAKPPSADWKLWVNIWNKGTDFTLHQHYSVNNLPIFHVTLRCMARS